MILDGDIGFSKSGLVPSRFRSTRPFLKQRKGAIRLFIPRALLRISREKGRN